MRGKVTRLAAILIVCLVLTAAPSAFAQDASTEEDSSNIEYLKSMMDMIKEKYNGQLTDKQLVEGALKGMFNSMDRYTEYYTLDEANDFLTEVDGNYEGIGVMISNVENHIVIVKVFGESPAEAAGLAAGDTIITVDGKSVDGISSDEVSKLIKGISGTRVVLGIISAGKTDIKSVTVSRSQIKINPVSYKIVGNVGYIKLDIFNRNVSEYLDKALEEMDSRNITRILLDLRDNPGGEVNQVVEVSRRFIPEGLITKLDFKSEDTADVEYYSYLKTPKYKLVVLVNDMSASASEILAGAVQDTKAGTLVGTKTFGKAKVQNLIPILSPEAYKKYEAQLGVKIVDASELIYKYGIKIENSDIIGLSKITTAEYTTPNGRMIDQKGLDPDIYVENTETLNDISISSIERLKKLAKMKVGDEGLEVINAEKILKAAGFDIDAPDMVMDQKTASAVAEFQQKLGLFPYGVIDFTTQQALNDKLDELVLKTDLQYVKGLELLNK